MNRLQAIAFDLDGTLLDTVPWFIGIYKQTLLEVAGINISTADLLAVLGPPEPEVFKFLAPNHKENCVKYFHEKSEATIHEVNEIPGMNDVLSILKDSGIPMGLVTSRDEPLATKLLQHFGLSSFFQSFYFGEGSRSKKVEDLLHLANSFQVSPQQSAYVGDFETDYKASRDAQFVPLVAMWGESVVAYDWVPKQVAKFETTTEFLNWLRYNRVITNGG